MYSHWATHHVTTIHAMGEAASHEIDREPPYNSPMPNVALSPFLVTTFMLVASNVFMTFAWYAHLKNLADKPWYLAALVSWGIAIFEYSIMVPANRTGFAAGMSLGQLKIVQEVVTLSVFVPFALFYMGDKWTWNYLWAGLCLVGAVYFIFRG